MTNNNRAGSVTPEVVRYVSRPHWAMLLPAYGLILLACLSIPYLSTIGCWNRMIWLGLAAYQLLSLCLALAGAVYALISLYYLSACEYRVTDKQLIISQGIGSTRTTQVVLRHIDRVIVTQSWLGWLLNYGEVVITGSQGSNERYSYVPSPLAFREALLGGD